MNRQAELAKKGIGLAKGKLRKKGKISQDDPKLARKSRNSEKTANKAALRKVSRRIGAIIVVAIDANATVALTNRKEAYKPNKGTAREENVRLG